MQFQITETIYVVDDTEPDAELVMQRHYEELGYSVINNAASILVRPGETHKMDEWGIIERIVGKDRIAWATQFSNRLLTADGAHNNAPGHPDLFVYKDDGSKWFFVEVKQRNDYLKLGGMIGISMLHAMFGTRVEIARVNRSYEEKHSRARTYRWVWPCIQELNSTQEYIDPNAGE
ncbi:MAG TPA: hypothetical protein EYM99_08005 [Alphaproteobacteria bacterium]|nr:hypothetical protein [Planctomycetaceae bacterium]HIN92750.1 hypothetical protein [Alphaproteobacteria bacterium]